MARTKYRFWYHFLDVLFNIVVIMAIVATIRTFLVAPFQVEGSSMVDTLADKEYIIINKFVYLVGEPERGDVVVFRPPNEPSKYYVKRVIGLPGDSVTIKDGFVYVKAKGESEFKKLDESKYLNDRNLGKTFKHPPSSGDKTAVTYEVEDGKYFLLGDNRQGSLDSRSFTAEDGKPIPFVARREIKGRVWFIALPVTKIQALETPDYAL
jgi:signal peptidase I